jgi:hypothetical protein
VAIDSMPHVRRASGVAGVEKQSSAKAAPRKLTEVAKGGGDGGVGGGGAISRSGTRGRHSGSPRPHINLRNLRDRAYWCALSELGCRCALSELFHWLLVRSELAGLLAVRSELCHWLLVRSELGYWRALNS